MGKYSHQSERWSRKDKQYIIFWHKTHTSERRVKYGSASNSLNLDLFTAHSTYSFMHQFSLYSPCPSSCSVSSQCSGAVKSSRWRREKLSSCNSAIQQIMLLENIRMRGKVFPIEELQEVVTLTPILGKRTTLGLTHSYVSRTSSRLPRVSPI